MEQLKLSNKDTIEKNFTFHKATEDKGFTYTEIREKAKELALYLDEICPNSREKSIAMTKLEEVVFWINAGIARS